MYERYFGFAERPFDLTPNPRFVVLTDVHREALSNLEYAIASRKGITLLVGEAGLGKTTLIRAAIAKQPARVHCVHIQNPALTREEFIETLAARFGLGAPAQRSKATLLDALDALLRRRVAAGETTVLIIDEAQSLSRDLLEEVRLLANIESDDEKLVSVILAGQPEIGARLKDETLRQLKQRVALRCDLRALTRNETAAYLAGRIRAAGGKGADVFTREAVESIHEHSGGIPRTINVLADNALLAAFGRQQRPVTRQMVREVCRDFDLGAVGEAPPLVTGPAPAFGPETPAAAGRLLSVPEPADDVAGDPVVAAAGLGGEPERSLFGGIGKRRWLFFSKVRETGEL
jgi:type II secretory pathway predicted ATPase ExeA